MLKTITINVLTHKVVPLMPNEDILQAGQSSGKKFAWSYARCYQDMIAAAPEFNESLWINAKDRLPDVKSGNCEEFIVHARSIYGGKAHVFAAMYLNERELDDPEEGYERLFTGWYSAKEHNDYDIYYETLSSHEILHWMPLPPAPEGI